jgi:cholesterol transport system auxiliary component
LALTEIESSAALDGTSVLYRLAYADAQQLQPYALARWSMPPAQLVRQRLRDALSQRGPVLGAGEAAAPLTLRVELDEFSQLFQAPDQSSGLVRLRATLTRNDSLLGQRTFIVQRPAPTANAAGGARALAAATDAAVDEISAWLAQTLR